MKISLSEFEHQIDEIILKRGLQYYREGHISHIEELGAGEYEASVEGSEDYTVNLTIRNGIVEDYRCDCPYDMGPVCKHIAATLFYLQKDYIDIDNIPVSKKKISVTSSQPKKETIPEQIEEILTALSDNDLKGFIRQACKSDKEFRFRFLTKFAYINAPASASKEFYKSQIQDLADVYSGQYGFIAYREVGEFSRAVSEMLDDSRRNIENKKYKDALSVIFAVLEEVTPVLNSADDSGGYIGGCIEEAIRLLDTLVDENMDESLRIDIFNQLVTTYGSGKLDGWDWKFDLISFAIRLLKTSQEKEQIKAIINKIKPTGKSWDWDYRKAQELMQELLLKTESEGAVIQYLKENISNPDFREKLIGEAIRAKDYQYALELTHDGIAKDDKEFSGLADKWREYQLDIYQKRGDNENTIRLARYFVMNRNGYSQSLKYYYDLLKKTIPADSWDKYLENIIAEIFKKGKWVDYEKLASFYIWEEYWERYLSLLQKNTTLSRIEAAEKHLGALYPEQLVTLYDTQLRSFVENNIGRSHYKDACRYMRRMKKLGGSQIVDKLIGDLRIQYKNRRALLEELTKV
ncbi:SWIM zinc finger family protein [uncultured Proteiniphilum sp.]|uniref:SWIM zinc finger family protein n=1 Tax=uncultured Proteiniphilum sp. TaxID=497637 RepID=UPI002604B123|nr:SWIM zinc finger family protein [uncultured Proteiniphilum sp.]